MKVAQVTIQPDDLEDVQMHRDQETVSFTVRDETAKTLWNAWLCDFDPSEMQELAADQAEKAKAD